MNEKALELERPNICFKLNNLETGYMNQFHDGTKELLQSPRNPQVNEIAEYYQSGRPGVGVLTIGGEGNQIEINAESLETLSEEAEDYLTYYSGLKSYKSQNSGIPPDVLGFSNVFLLTETMKTTNNQTSHFIKMRNYFYQKKRSEINPCKTKSGRWN